MKKILSFLIFIIVVVGIIFGFKFIEDGSVSDLLNSFKSDSSDTQSNNEDNNNTPSENDSQKNSQNNESKENITSNDSDLEDHFSSEVFNLQDDNSTQSFSSKQFIFTSSYISDDEQIISIKHSETIDYTNGKIETKESEVLEDNITTKTSNDYYPNGQLKTKVIKIVDNGKVNITMESYYNNGQLASSGKIRGGKKIGHWEEYDESGKLIYDGVYQNGERVNEKKKPNNNNNNNNNKEKNNN